MKTALTITLAAHAAALTPADVGAGDGASSAHWIQLLPAGRFSARDGRGPFDAGGEDELKRIVASTLRFLGNSEMMVDYDHQSVFGAVPGVGGTAKAAGWVKRLEVRQDGIWGLVEWTPSAAEAIRAGEYRYISPLIMTPKGSTRVISIRTPALLNTPALDMQPVAAAALLTTEGTEMDKIEAALGLAVGSGEDVVLSALNALLMSTAAIAVALGMEKDAKASDVQTAALAVVADRKAMAEAAGQAADAATDVIVAALKASVAGGKPDPAKYVPLSAVTDLQAQLKDLRDQVGGDKAEASVLKAIEDGKLAPALKDWGIDLAKKDLAQFEAFTAGAPKLTEPQLKTAKRKAGETSDLTTEQAEVASALGIDAATYAKTISAEQETL